MGSAGTREECQGLVETHCPDANGATLSAGECLCEFWMDAFFMPAADTEACLFAVTTERWDWCYNNWQQGALVDSTLTVALPGVSSKDECFRECFDRAETEGLPNINCLIFKQGSGCECHACADKSSAAPAVVGGDPFCIMTCSSFGFFSGKANEVSPWTSLGDFATWAECLDESHVRTPFSGGMQMSRDNGTGCVSAPDILNVVKATADDANYVICYDGHMPIMETVTPTPSVTTSSLTIAATTETGTTTLEPETMTMTHASTSRVLEATTSTKTVTTVETSIDTATWTATRTGAELAPTTAAFSQTLTRTRTVSSTSTTLTQTVTGTSSISLASSTSLTSTTSSISDGTSRTSGSPTSGSPTSGSPTLAFSTSQASSSPEAMVTSSLTTSATRPESADVHVLRAMAMQAAVSSAVEYFRGDLRGSRSNENGDLVVHSLKAMLASIVHTGKGSLVILPRSLLEALPAGSALSVLHPALEGGRDPFDGVLGSELDNRLRAPSMELSVYDAQGQPIRKLPEPLVFRLAEPLPYMAPDEFEASAVCVFLEIAGGKTRWSTQGVRRATDEEVLKVGGTLGGIWCRTEHLSIFTALAGALLGCMNLELLTSEAMSAITENEGWWQVNAAVIIFVTLGVMLLLVLCAAGRESLMARKGYSHQNRMQVSICRNFCAHMGLQLLKHKYTVFLIYLKEVLQCLRSGRSRLQKPTLLAGVQRCLALRTGVSTSCISGHCWSGGAWLETDTPLLLPVLRRKLEFHAGGVEAVVRGELAGRGPQHGLQRFLILFLTCHPLLEALRLGYDSMTVRKRAMLQLAAFLGVLATNALIFNFSGAQRSWEAEAECPIPQTSQFFVIVATCVSIVCNAVPNSMLLELAKQVHGRCGWTLVFWLLCLLYTGLGALLLLIALANLNLKDQSKWHDSLRWALTVKFLGFPVAQALRKWMLLEHFVREEEGPKGVEAMLGLRHVAEEELPEAEKEAAAELSSRGISLEELLRFTALLGDKVLLDFSPETTCQDVFEGAVRLFLRQPSPQELCLIVEVEQAIGLQASKLGCSVLLLGEKVGKERPRLAQRRMEARSGAWHFRANLPGAELGHVLGFEVMDGKVALSATLPVCDFLEAGSFAGELPLLRAGEAVGKLRVKVTVPPAYMEAVAITELRRARKNPPGDDGPGAAIMRRAALRRRDGPVMKEASGQDGGFLHAAYMEAGQPQVLEGFVVHSPQASFLHLVAWLLAEEEEVYEEILKKLQTRDFAALSARLGPRRDARFLLEMFATDQPWQRGFFEKLPTALRSTRKACCQHMIAQLEARGSNALPCRWPQQLLILDQDLTVLQHASCLAQVLVANAMGMSQRLLLQSAQLEGKGLAMGLAGLLEPDDKAPDWAMPFVGDRAAVYVALRAFTLKALEGRNDDKALLQLDDVAAVNGAMLTSPSSSKASLTSRRLDKSDGNLGDAAALDDAGDASGDCL